MGIKPSASRITLTTSYEIFVTDSNGNRRAVGAIQSINPSEDKEITPSFEIGTSNGARIGEPFELTGGLVRSKSLEVTRLKLYTKNMLEAFGSIAGAQTLYEQDTPFDVEEVVTIPAFRTDGTPNPDPAAASRRTLKIYKDCLISRLGSTRDIARGDIRETETATIMYRTVITPATQNRD